MKPPRFAYHDPRSLDEALALLAEHQLDAKPLAGGQSLMPLLNMRLARPAHLIDLGQVPGLAAIVPNGELVVGALVRQRDLELDPAVQTGWPLFREAMAWIAHPTIRNRGTVGGSLAHADPAAELPLLAVALDAVIELASVRGRRLVPAAEFFLSYFTTAAAPDELVVAVHWPRQPVSRGWCFQEMARRHGDFALVAVACLLGVDSTGRCTGARLAVGACAPVPLRMQAVEDLLVGQFLEAALFDQVADAVAATLDPEPDLHATAAYRRQVAGNLTRRALLQAGARALGTKEVG